MIIKLNHRISINPKNKVINNPFLKVHIEQERARESFGKTLRKAHPSQQERRTEIDAR